MQSSANIINTTNDTSKYLTNTFNYIIKAIAATDAPRATSPSSLPGFAKLHVVSHMGIYKAPHINIIIADVNNYVINITKDIIDISMNLADGRVGAIIYTLSLLNVILIITIYTYRNSKCNVFTKERDNKDTNIYNVTLSNSDVTRKGEKKGRKRGRAEGEKKGDYRGYIRGK